MSRSWTVQCTCAIYQANTVTVEADTLEAALAAAITAANQDASWKSIDHCGETFVDAAVAGVDADPWTTDSQSRCEIPFRFSEAALWADAQPGFAAMREALTTIAAGQAVARDGDSPIEPVEGAAALALAALAAAGCHSSPTG